MYFVLPAFADLYGSLGAKLPALTQVLISFSEFLRQYIMHIFLGIAIVVLTIIAYLRTADGKYKMNSLMLKLPMLGRVNLLNELARACRSISCFSRRACP
jgi:type IV pilus assembly protein PilC